MNGIKFKKSENKQHFQKSYLVSKVEVNYISLSKADVASASFLKEIVISSLLITQVVYLFSFSLEWVYNVQVSVSLSGKNSTAAGQLSLYYYILA